MAHLTCPAEVSGVSAGSFPETAAGNRAYDEVHNMLLGHTYNSTPADQMGQWIRKGCTARA